MWEVWYGLEAANYLNDNGELVADLFSPWRRWQKAQVGPKTATTSR